MIISSFKHRFENLKKIGKHIQYVLDIGAYRGDFTETVLSVWPTSIIRQIEADERQKQYLKTNAIIALLGNEQDKIIDFYTLDENKITTGSSIYRELTHHYSENVVVMSKKMTTLDVLDEKFNFYGDWKNYGLIKLDTQGSELLILDGAKQFLSIKKPNWILIECSVQQYNLNAPTIFQTIEYLDKLSYVTYDVFDLNYDSQGKLLQMDILFERKK